MLTSKMCGQAIFLPPEQELATVAATQMIECDLAYGRGRLALSLPKGATRVIAPKFPPPLAEPEAVLRAALAEPVGAAPLAQLIGPDESLAIVFCDYTRPAPSRLMIEAIIDSLPPGHAGDISLINALGLHRPNSPAELEEMLGPGLLARFEVVQVDAGSAGSFASVGMTSSGRPVALCRQYVQADRRITTGFVEPHFFAGFSGGAKLTLPGVASPESIMANHDAQMIDDANSTWGRTDTNPIFREQREAAALCPPDLIVNVALDARKRITAVYCGELTETHRRACHEVAACANAPLANRFDLVISSNSGFPLDQNFYQAVKGLSAAAQFVRPGGDLVIASQCQEGVGHGHFAAYLARGLAPKHLLAQIRQQPCPRADQWQAQILAKVLARARVHVRADGLSDRQIRSSGCEPCHDISALAGRLTGGRSDYSIAVLPEGPLTIAMQK